MQQPELIAEAHRAADDLDPGSLRRAVARMGDPEGPSPLWAFVMVAQTLLALLEHRPLEQLPFLEKVASFRRRWLEPDGFSARLLHRGRLELLLAGGELQRAATLLGRHSPSPPELRVPMARFLMHSGHPTEALELVTTALSDPLLTPRERGSFETIRAAAELMSHRPAAARMILRRLVSRSSGPPPGWSIQMFLLPRELRLELLSLIPCDDIAAPLLLRLSRSFDPRRVGGEHLVHLSAREMVVLGELRRGGTIAEIAARLSVSPNTVKKQTISIYHALGVGGRAAALTRAAQVGIFDEVGLREAR